MRTDPVPPSVPIIRHLKQYGQQLDSEIAAATGLPLKVVLRCLDDLYQRGEISRCNVIRYSDNKPENRILCRIAGSIPISSPGRKPGSGN